MSDLRTEYVFGVFAEKLDEVLKEIAVLRGQMETIYRKNEDDATVSRKEYELLLRRIKHLLASDFIRSFDEYDGVNNRWKRDIRDADRIVFDLVDKENLVRCEDCKHYEPFTYKGVPVGRGVCNLLPMDKTISDSWFCADGERKEKEND